MVHSCDIYFYEVGRRLGIDRINEWSRRFGLGAPTGLDLDKEMPGLAPSSAWKKARFHQPWHEGDTISVSIGQGYNLTTPIQMARVVAAIANGGIVYKPYLVEKVESPAGEILYQAKPEVQSRLGASPANLEAVRQSLVGVVNDGTAKAARLPNIQVAGKTGTAQVVAMDRDNPKKKQSPGQWKITPGSWPTPRPTTPGWPWRSWWSTAATAAPKTPLPWPAGSSRPACPNPRWPRRNRFCYWSGSQVELGNPSGHAGCAWDLPMPATSADLPPSDHLAA